MTRAGSRPGQQRRPSPQGAEEEDAARGRIPRDEAPRPLRKAVGTQSAGTCGGDPPRPQARPQKAAARRSAADEAEAETRYAWPKRAAAHAPLLSLCER